jgi:GDP-mannose 6-dehydrogenase
MRISVFGLGYVGCITAACLAHEGHTVIGVDVNEAKVRAIQEGLSPLLEPGLADIIEEVTNARRLQTTLDAGYAIMNTDVSLVCVGTPSMLHGGLDARYVLGVCRQIGAAVKGKIDYHVVALRSTMLPQVFRECRLELHDAADRMEDMLGCVANPEFLREGSGVHDFYQPPLTVIGATDPRAGDVLAQLYAGLPGAIVRTDPDTAMLVKYASNAFHALKITFANELGRLCEALDVDAQQVMDIFCQDTTLNISSRYLKPGYAFGGSCLPKDLRAIVHTARHHDVAVPMIEAILPSNQLQIQRVVESIVNDQHRRVGLIGLAFKPNTDDLRESPLVQLAEILLGKGCTLKIYDECVHPPSLVGSNRVYINQAIPHLASLMCDSLAEVITTADVLVVSRAPDLTVRRMVEELATTCSVIDLDHVLSIQPAEQRVADMA